MGGSQAEGTVAFYRDPANGNWVLFYFDGTHYIQSGYYPAELFQGKAMSGMARWIEFGGEVYNPPGRGNLHTATDMGSGNFPAYGTNFAAYQRGLKYMTPAGSIVDFPAATATRRITNPSCYDISAGSSAAWGAYIFFGGPGYSGNCLYRN